MRSLLRIYTPETPKLRGVLGGGETGEARRWSWEREREREVCKIKTVSFKGVNESYSSQQL